MSLSGTPVVLESADFITGFFEGKFREFNPANDRSTDSSGVAGREGSFVVDQTGLEVGARGDGMEESVLTVGASAGSDVGEMLLMPED